MFHNLKINNHLFISSSQFHYLSLRKMISNPIVVVFFFARYSITCVPVLYYCIITMDSRHISVYYHFLSRWVRIFACIELTSWVRMLKRGDCIDLNSILVLGIFRHQISNRELVSIELPRLLVVRHHYVSGSDWRVRDLSWHFAVTCFWLVVAGERSLTFPWYLYPLDFRRCCWGCDGVLFYCWLLRSGDCLNNFVLLD